MGMEIRSAQQDVQSAYLRGSVAQAIMGIFWLVSAALGTWVDERSAIGIMVLAVLLTLRLLGCPAGLPVLHSMNQLIFGSP
jgi:hypothetical protein